MTFYYMVNKLQRWKYATASVVHSSLPLQMKKWLTILKDWKNDSLLKDKIDILGFCIAE